MPLPARGSRSGSRRSRGGTRLAEALRGTYAAMQRVEPFPITVGEAVLTDLREAPGRWISMCGRAAPAGERLGAVDERREPKTDEFASRTESHEV
jgi:hypothetical protein